MKTIRIGCALALLAILLLPSAPAPAAQARETKAPQTPGGQVLFIRQTQYDGQAAEAQDAVWTGSDGAQLQLLCDGQTQAIGVREYLTAVVLCEMPASFEPEALKAQAVAARTFLWKQAQAGKHEGADVCADSACCQAWMGEDTLRGKLGADYDAARQKAAQAVRQTQDEVICYDGALIDATYFSCSGGSTEAAVAVWGTDVPYLQAVQSPGEEQAARYESEVRVSCADFRATIMGEDDTANLSGEPQTWFGEIVFTDGGGVDTARIGGAEFSGVRLRQLFGLNSTKFTVLPDGEDIVFHVLGFGHRVGMSQYGADRLAQNGFSYRVILQYYYQNTRIKKLSRNESGQYQLSN